MTMPSFEQMLTILAALMPFLIPLGQALYQSLLQRLPSAQRAELQSVVGVVVNGVEMQSQKSVMSSADKKAAATTAITAIAKSVGLGKYATPTMVSMLIEAAVFTLNQAASSAAPAGLAPSVSQPAELPAL